MPTTDSNYVFPDVPSRMEMYSLATGYFGILNMDTNEISLFDRTEFPNWLGLAKSRGFTVEAIAQVMDSVAGIEPTNTTQLLEAAVNIGPSLFTSLNIDGVPTMALHLGSIIPPGGANRNN